MFGITIVRISGSSMEPRLRSGDFGVFLRRRRYQIGDIVLVQHPRLGKIVKVLRTLQGDEVTLEGTSPLSTSSAAMGQLPTSAILGRLIFHIT